jgi:murein L,D-transpeptidase YcbB/YkuD
VDLELLCTDAFLLYGSHLLTGRVDPAAINPTWTAEGRRADLVRHLEQALTNTSLRAALADLRPPQPEYDALRRALYRYRTLDANGGWPTLPEGPKLEAGTQDERVPLLRRRLRITGDLAASAAPEDSLTVDSTLAQGVQRFQERHGLAVDGVVGPATRAALNVPADERIQQIRTNLERWRWLPADLGGLHVRVNIAGYELRVVENGTDVLRMRVVTGQAYRQTPVFSDQISYLVLNPYWHVPHSIAVKDKLPDFQRDPSLVSRLGYEVFRGWGADATPIDPSTIDWSALSASTFPYRLRQRPGPQNALGQIKFMFPNAHSVYLHDTPSRYLFDRATRSFSSGCIRVEHPLDLAVTLLRHNEGWTRERLRAATRGDTERTVMLAQKVPVHLLYWTAWAEADGPVQFRRDVYDRDGAVRSALAAPPRPLSPPEAAPNGP